MSELFSILSVNFADKSGVTHSTKDVFDSHIVGLFFGASWCHHCTDFSDVLGKFYNTFNKKRKSFEVIFVPQDANISHFEQFPWISLKPGSSLVQKLSSHYNIHSVPTFIVFDSDGQMVDKDGRRSLYEMGIDAFKFWDGNSGKKLCDDEKCSCILET